MIQDELWGFTAVLWESLTHKMNLFEAWKKQEDLQRLMPTFACKFLHYLKNWHWLNKATNPLEYLLCLFRVFIQIIKSYSYVFPFQCCHLLQLFRGQHSKSLKVFDLIGNYEIKYDHMFSKIWIQIQKLFAAAIHYQNQLTTSRYFAFFVLAYVLSNLI